MKSRCNWRCRFGFHHWKFWTEVDYDVGFIFDYVKCDRPRCKWSGLTWVDRTPIPLEIQEAHARLARQGGANESA